MNRKEIVDKHSPMLKMVQPRAPLSIGNGDFGMSVDFTGLQSFPEAYIAPLSTQSNWGWHASGEEHSYTLEDVKMQHYQGAPYPLFPEGKEEAYHWLRQNPHRLQLGQIAFRFYDENGKPMSREKINPITQQLKLWEGIIVSKFLVDGEVVKVETCCDPYQDIIAVSVKSAAMKSGRFAIELAFPSPNIFDQKWEETLKLNWQKEGHKTTLQLHEDNLAVFYRQADDTEYAVQWNWNKGDLKQEEDHTFSLIPSKKECRFTLSFAENKTASKSVEEVFTASRSYWDSFWLDGGFLSFQGSTDPRKDELERRVVLSQYLLAIHSGGSMPPQETGFMYNSWFGKFHLEMHWWHASHFALWGRASILKKSMDWYLATLSKAYQLAKSQRYEGARWPKMVAREGNQTPSPIAPGLIWQQPHPISLLELCYQDNQDPLFLEKYQEIVFASADFMASFVRYDQENDVYDLGPGLIPAQENHMMEDSVNPPYELEYWHFGLTVAIEWCLRLGKEVPGKWIEVKEKLAKPRVKDGIYLAHQNCANTFTKKNHDHPSMVASLGVLPGALIDKDVMLQTLYKVKEEWEWETAWGWDFPMCAMTAARLGELDLAVDFLLMDQVKNTYLINGHNYQHDALTAYLPGNGGLLTAIAMMASTWGFPDNWKVKYQGLKGLME
ncbi:glycoside hydrolase family 65 [Gracilibacillus kekensis]|uniref:Glycoside hydrolase family 65 n=1 Tax=Gracilibacillus kekensis TaxID=1027249 RepID=A0A1M7JI85_9BACI|nr:glycoside hydrolase family 65 [Gracilibacillus kekensis]SHM52790.1 hypothetical protein SAMN05216179_0375 [Gracilibacillus kekensis]